MAAPLSARALAALAAVFALFAWLESAVGGFGYGDETWFLQVLDRVAGGDVLYRDVFFGSTPLTVWAGLPAVKLFGSELLVVKAEVAVAIGVLGAGVVKLALDAGISRRGAILLAASVVCFGARFPSSPYTWGAMAGAIWALVAADAFRRDPRQHLLLLAGAAAGLAAASKYTIGFLALLAAAGLVARRTPRAMLPVGAAFAGVLALAILPVLLTGGGERFLEYGFTAKGTYVDAGGLSYFETAEAGLHALWEAATSPSRETLQPAATGLMVLAPVAAALVAVPAWRRGAPAVVLVLAVLALAGAFPRYEDRHLMTALAGPVLLIGVAAHLWLPHGWWRRAALLAATGWVAANAIGGVLPQGGARPTDIAHLSGVFVPDTDAEQSRTRARALARAADAGPLFVVSGAAGLDYLLSGVENVTPYDYPYVTAFGKDGEAETAAQVRAGRFAAVCLDEEIDERLRPRRLERAIREAMTAGAALPGCRLFHRR